MLLTIHNLPYNTTYGGLKQLIFSKCGLTDIILDQLVIAGNVKKVTIGLADEGDAAILFREINGLLLDGQTLYVENVKKKKEQSYRPAGLATEYGSFPQAKSITTEIVQTNQYYSPTMGQLQMMHSYNMPQNENDMLSNMNSASMGYYNRNKSFSSYQANYSGPLVSQEKHLQREEKMYEASQNRNSYRNDQRQDYSQETERSRPNIKIEDYNFIRENDHPNRPSFHQSWNPESHHLENISENNSGERFGLQEMCDSGRSISYQYESKMIKEKVRPLDKHAMSGSSPLGFRGGDNYRKQDTTSNRNSRNEVDFEHHKGISKFEHQLYVSSDADRFTKGSRFDDFRNKTELGDKRSDQSFKIKNRFNERSVTADRNLVGGERYKNHRISGNRDHDPDFRTSNTSGRASGSGSRDFRLKSSAENISQRSTGSGTRNFGVGSKLDNNRGNEIGFRQGSRIDINTRGSTSNDMGSRVYKTISGSDSDRTLVDRDSGLGRDEPNYRRLGPPPTTDKQIMERNMTYSNNSESWAQADKSLQRKRPANTDSYEPPVGPKIKRPTEHSFVASIESNKDRSDLKSSSTSMIHKDETWRGQAASRIAKGIVQTFNSCFSERGHAVFKALKSSIRSRIDVIMVDRFAMPEDDIVNLYRKKFQPNTDKGLLDTIINEVKSGKTQIVHHDVIGSFAVNKSTNQKTSSNITNTKIEKNNQPTAEISNNQTGSINQTGLMNQKGAMNQKVPMNQQVSMNQQVPMNQQVSMNQQILRSQKPLYNQGKVNSKPVSTQLPRNLSGKALGKEQKKIARAEYSSDAIYTLPPDLQKALDEEIKAINDKIIEACANPGDEDEKVICAKITEQCIPALNKVIRLNITKRILNIKTGLVLRAIGHPKAPKKPSLMAFLANYGCINLTKSEKEKKIFIVNVNSYENYDKLCATGGIVFEDNIIVNFAPLHIAGPPTKITRDQIKRNRADWINRQIERNTDSAEKVDNIQEEHLADPNTQVKKEFEEEFKKYEEEINPIEETGLNPALEYSHKQETFDEDNFLLETEADLEDY